MKKILLFVAIIGAAAQLQAQCDEVFISEYVEGTHNNKAIEIYNPTDEAVDLSNYQLERYSNGSSNASVNQRLVLSGMVDPYDVRVFVIDKRNPDGTGNETPVWEELQDQADEFVAPDYNVNNAIYFNGNDAVALRNLNNNTIIDLIGKIGEEPALDSTQDEVQASDGNYYQGGWNNVPPSHIFVVNFEIPWTEDHTMMRKSEVTQGVMSNPTVFNPGLEWDTLAVNTFENLGSHVSICNPDLILEEEAESISIYPNPSEGWFVINSTSALVGIEIYDLSGKVVYSTTLNNGQKRARIDVILPKGMYLIEGVLKDGHSLQSKMIVK